MTVLAPTAPSTRGGDPSMSRTLRLHDYQLVARDFLRGRNRAALLLDM